MWWYLGGRTPKLAVSGGANVVMIPWLALCGRIWVSAFAGQFGLVEALVSKSVTFLPFDTSHDVSFVVQHYLATNASEPYLLSFQYTSTSTRGEVLHTNVLGNYNAQRAERHDAAE